VTKSFKDCELKLDGTPLPAISEVEYPPIEVREDELRAEREGLAERVGMTVAEVNAALERGDFKGTILESKWKSIAFLLGEDDVRLPKTNNETTARVAQAAIAEAGGASCLAAVEYRSERHGTVGLVGANGQAIVRYSWRLEGDEVVLGDV